MVSQEFKNDFYDLFENISNKLLEKLKKEYEENRIKGSEFSKIFSSILISISDEALKVISQYEQTLNSKKDRELKDIEIELKNKQLLLLDAQIEEINKNIALKEKQIELSQKEIEAANKEIELKDKQIALMQEQTRHFNVNAKFKLYDSQLKAWTGAFSSGMLDNFPTPINDTNITNVYNSIANDIGV